MKKRRSGSKKMSASDRRKELAAGLKKQVDSDRKKVDQSKTQSIVEGNIPIWKPGIGDHTIDILPYFAGGNHPDVQEGRSTYRFEYYFHRDVGVGNQRVLCLQAMGIDRCPICEHRAELIEEKADESKWKPLRPKQWCLFNVIVYDSKAEEKKGVQVWDSPYFWSMENIMDIAKERKRGREKSGGSIDFANPDTGKSISFTIKPPKSQNDYHKYSGFKFEERDYKISDRLLDSCYVLDEIVPVYSPKEIEEMYYGSKSGRRGIQTDEGEEEEEEGDDPFELLEQAEDIDDLKEIVKNFDLDVKIKRSSKFKRTKRLVKEELEEMHDKEEDEDEEEVNIDDDALTSEDIEDMSWKELVKTIKKHDLEIDPDDYSDEADLAEVIIEELELI